MKALNCEIVESGGSSPDATFIWLHGLGADGNDFVPVAELLCKKLPCPLRFVLPYANPIPVTVNGGMKMPAWYDIIDMKHPRNINLNTLTDTLKQIDQLIEREINNGQSIDKIILAGFSQGGAVCLELGLKGSKNFGGILALSTYLVSDKGLIKKNLPVFMAHGEYDLVIPPFVAEQSRDVIIASGNKVDWNFFPIEHSVSAEEIEVIAKWIASNILHIEK